MPQSPLHTPATPEDVLHFWFEQLTPQQHFAKDADLDAAIAQRFGPAFQQPFAQARAVPIGPMRRSLLHLAGGLFIKEIGFICHSNGNPLPFRRLRRK